MHFLTPLIKFILWLTFFYRPKAGGGLGWRSILGRPCRVLLLHEECMLLGQTQLWLCLLLPFKGCSLVVIWPHPFRSVAFLFPHRYECFPSFLWECPILDNDSIWQSTLYSLPAWPRVRGHKGLSLNFSISPDSSPLQTLQSRKLEVWVEGGRVLSPGSWLCWELPDPGPWQMQRSDSQGWHLQGSSELLQWVLYLWLLWADLASLLWVVTWDIAIPKNVILYPIPCCSQLSPAFWVVLLALRHPTGFSSMRPMWVLGKHPYIPSSLGEHTDLILALLFAYLDL